MLYNKQYLSSQWATVSKRNVLISAASCDAVFINAISVRYVGIDAGAGTMDFNYKVENKSNMY